MKPKKSTPERAKLVKTLDLLARLALRSRVLVEFTRDPGTLLNGNPGEVLEHMDELLQEADKLTVGSAREFASKIVVEFEEYISLRFPALKQAQAKRKARRKP